MSKMDDLRSMREAKYARGKASAPKPAPAKPAVPTATAAATPAAAAAPVDEGRCGHRSMNGRSCTRETGHSEKSHRYS